MICVAFLDRGIYTVKQVSDFPVPSRCGMSLTGKIENLFLTIYFSRISSFRNKTRIIVKHSRLPVTTRKHFLVKKDLSSTLHSIDDF
jgi:hypothetical protein